MRIFLRLSVLLFLTAIFVLAEMFGGPANRLDISVIRYLADVRAEAPGFTRGAIVLTQFGSVYATIGVGAIYAIRLVWKRAYGTALLLAVTILAERSVADALKLLFVRPRPNFDIHPVMTSSWSFPSGHAANSMTAYLAIALIAVPAAWRRPAVIIALVLVAAIGATRCFLGVHWPSDVIGGWSLGLIAIWVAITVGERSGTLRVEPQHDIVGGHGAPLAKDETA